MNADIPLWFIFGSDSWIYKYVGYKTKEIHKKAQIAPVVVKVNQQIKKISKAKN